MFLLGFFLSVNVVNGASISVISYGTYIPPLELPPPKTLMEKIMSEFSNDPIMIEVARCESEFRQFQDNGDVLRGIVNSKDVGIYQINEKYHLANSQQLNYNIYTEDGNIQMARYLYNAQGTKPWSASKDCWSKSS